MCIFMKSADWINKERIYAGVPLCEVSGGPCWGATCQDFFTCGKDTTPASKCDLGSCTQPCAFRDFKVQAVADMIQGGKRGVELMLEGDG